MTNLMQVLPRVLVLAFFLWLGGATPGSPSTVVLTQSRISTPAGVTNDWWQIVPSPDDPDKLLVCQLQSDVSRDTFVQAVLYGSDDAGETWRTLKSTNDLSSNSEASCAIGSHGRAYFTISVGNQLPKTLSEVKRRMYLWSSPDFGKSWHLGPHLPYTDAAILTALPGGARDDRLFDIYSILVAKNVYGGRLVNVFDSNGTDTQTKLGLPVARCGAALAASDLSGKGLTGFGLHVPGPSVNDLPPGTGLLPARPSDCKVRVLAEGARLLDNDTLGAVFMEWTWQPQRARIAFSRLSTDGKSASVPVVVAPLTPDFSKWMYQHAGNFENASLDPGLGSGPAPDSSGKRIYITWHDQLKNHLRILLATSSDRGATWTAPSPIDDAALRSAGGARPSPSHPSVAVNAQGIVAITWAEFSGNCWRVALSRDAGKHFEASIPLNPCDSKSKLSLGNELAGHIDVLSDTDLAFGRGVDAGSGFSVLNMRQSGGPVTRSMSIAAALDGSFYALWARQNALNDELHVTHIMLPGYASPRFQRRQEALQTDRCCYDAKTDVNRLALDYTSVDYDPATQEFTVGATLLARRKDITWPLVLRVTKLTSPLGELTASNPDNGIGGVGAAWVFDGPGAELPSSHAAANFKQLPTGEYAFSEPRTLRFRLAKPNEPLPAWAGRMDRGILLGVKVEILTPPTIGAPTGK